MKNSDKYDELILNYDGYKNGYGDELFSTEIMEHLGKSRQVVATCLSQAPEEEKQYWEELLKNFDNDPDIRRKKGL